MTRKSKDSSTEISEDQLDQVTGGVGALDALPVINDLNNSAPTKGTTDNGTVSSKPAAPTKIVKR